MLHVPKVVELTAARKDLFLVLAYLGQKSFEIRNRIQCYLQKNAQVFILKVAFQSKNRLSTLFSFNDKINKVLHSNLVYKVKCNICNDIYYGKAKLHFKIRTCEYLGITPLNGKKVKSTKESAVFDLFSIRVITLVLIILKPLSESLMNLDSSSESRF